MNVLSIGNSFAQDANRYLHRIARADSFELNTVNPYIGGCSLDKHFRNMYSNKEYSLEVNGESSGFFINIKEALLSREWDYITFQQQSSKSYDYNTFQPYLDEICEFAKEYSPKSKFVIFQSWAYDDECKRLSEQGFSNHKDMLDGIIKTYKKAAKDIGAEFIIPAGELVELLLENGIKKVHRDGYHLKKGIGRFAVGLLWYACLTGNSVENISFNDFDEPVSDEEIAIAKKCVMQLAKR